MLLPLIFPYASVEVPVIRKVPTPVANRERMRVSETVTLEVTSRTTPLPTTYPTRS